MDKIINQAQLKELVLVAAENLGIKYPAIIEKDYYVTQTVIALSMIENENFRLVFCGGTCLAKAHKIVMRMSEDIDFKIQLKSRVTSFSKSQLLKELEKFRAQIMKSLEISGLTVSNTVVRNEGKYLLVELIYPVLFASSSILRPHLLLEFTFADVRLTTNFLTIKTIIEDAVKLENLFPPLAINCVSLEETAIEKWVGLTRRIAAIERQYHYDDSTLVRHIYDLNLVHAARKINDVFFNLAKSIVGEDARQFRNQHPEYFVNPGAEIKKSLALLKSKSIWKDRYQEFVAAMVYDNAAPLKYSKALNVLEQVSLKVVANL